MTRHYYSRPAVGQRTQWGFYYAWPWKGTYSFWSWLFLPYSGYAVWEHDPKRIVEHRGCRILGLTISRWTLAGHLDTNESLVERLSWTPDNEEGPQ